MWWFFLLYSFNCCLCCWWAAKLLIEIVAWAPSYRRRCSPGVNTWPRRLSLSYHRIPSRCICRQLKCHSSAPRMFLLTKIEILIKILNNIKDGQSKYSLGICWHRTVFAMRSANYLCRSTRTTFRMSQSATRERNSRASGAGICRVWWREALRRASFPFQLRANRLEKKIKKKIVSQFIANFLLSQLTSRTISQWEDLRAKIMLLELSTLSKIPRPHCVV